MTMTVAVLVCSRPLDSVTGTRWTRWTPDSNFRAEYAPVAVDLDDGLFVAADAGLVGVQQFHLPAALLGVAHVHPQQLAREQGRLLAACRRAHFQDDVFLVVGVLGQQHDLQVVLQS